MLNKDMCSKQIKIHTNSVILTDPFPSPLCVKLTNVTADRLSYIQSCHPWYAYKNAVHKQGTISNGCNIYIGMHSTMRVS